MNLQIHTGEKPSVMCVVNHLQVCTLAKNLKKHNTKPILEYAVCHGRFTAYVYLN